MDLVTLKVAAKLQLTEASLLNNSTCLNAGLGAFVDQKILCSGLTLFYCLGPI